MTDRNSLEDSVESGKLVASGIVGSQSSNRRQLFRRLMALAGLGITGVLLSEKQTDTLRQVMATSGGTSGTALIIDGSPANTGIGTTDLQSSLSNGPAFAATATGGTGSIYGILGESNSSAGTGVQGIATSGTGVTIGVYGESDSNSDNAIGVDGYSKASTGATFGVFGQSDSTEGTGVDGVATAKTGSTYGVFGESDSSSGHGVDGWAAASTGTTYGVFGQSDSTGGTGVYGVATAQTGSTLGVYGESNSVNGIAVLAHAGNDGAIALAAKANSSTQSAHLQQWQNYQGSALSVVDKNGNLGIGTSTPTQALTIVGGSIQLDNAQQVYTKTSAGASVTLFSTDTSNNCYFGSPLLSGNLALEAGGGIVFYTGGGYQRAYFDSTGRLVTSTSVGIGTIPSHLLQLSGGAYSDGTTWNPASSIRWKENITPLTDGVETLRQLHPVAYNYKKTPGKRTMGFIAEEVGKILPTVVDWDKKEPEYAEGYDQTAILALAVQAIKEQQGEIEQLRTENNALRERIDALEQTLAAS